MKILLDKTQDIHMPLKITMKWLESCGLFLYFDNSSERWHVEVLD